MDQLDKRIWQVLQHQGKLQNNELAQQVVRRTVGRWVSNTYRRRPMILPVVVSA